MAGEQAITTLMALEVRDAPVGLPTATTSKYYENVPTVVLRTYICLQSAELAAAVQVETRLIPATVGDNR